MLLAEMRVQPKPRLTEGAPFLWSRAHSRAHWDGEGLGIQGDDSC